jgi:transcriptional regulator with XRE-family HTH domain
VRRLREAQAMTQSELAERVGLGRTSMTNLERGKQNPPLSLLPQIARALGISCVELLQEATSAATEVDQSVLIGEVHDDDLRRWASQLIADKSPAKPPVRRGRARGAR